jgi:hypothetical protein
MVLIYNLNESLAIPKQDSFPLSPIDGQTIRRDDFGGEVFTYNQSADEWLGDRVLPYDYGNISPVNSGAAFRFIGATVASAVAGYEVPYRIRFTHAAGNWNDIETGNLQLRRNGVTLFNIPVSGVNFLTTELDVTDPQYLTELLGTRTVLALYWVGSTGSMTRPTLQLQARRVLLPGE